VQVAVYHVAKPLQTKRCVFDYIGLYGKAAAVFRSHYYNYLTYFKGKVNREIYRRARKSILRNMRLLQNSV